MMKITEFFTDIKEVTEKNRTYSREDRYYFIAGKFKNVNGKSVWHAIFGQVTPEQKQALEFLTITGEINAIVLEKQSSGYYLSVIGMSFRNQMVCAIDPEQYAEYVR